MCVVLPTCDYLFLLFVVGIEFNVLQPRSLLCAVKVGSYNIEFSKKFMKAFDNAFGKDGEHLGLPKLKEVHLKGE